MTEERKCLYQRILYVGFVDIRNLSYQATNGTLGFALTTHECVACIAGLAEWLHELAQQAQDFSKWSKRNEQAFWLNYRQYCQEFPANQYPVRVHEVVAQLR